MRIEELPQIKGQVVWTLHDMWGFTGGCHYDQGCGRYEEYCGSCPVLGSRRKRDLSSRVFSRKKSAFDSMNLAIVTPSHWLANCARKSYLFGDRRIEVIPNGLDIQVFRPVPKKTVRELLLILMDRKVILFSGIWATRDLRKGFRELKAALQRFSAERKIEDIEVIVMGATRPRHDSVFGSKSYYMGLLHDEISTALVYAAADVFVAPSLQDNLPNTVMEALACGTPCVAFNIGGLPDMIEHMRNGYLAKPFDIEDLVQGIDWILEDEERLRKLSERARAKVEEEFDVMRIAARYVELYKSHIDKVI